MISYLLLTSFIPIIISVHLYPKYNFTIGERGTTYESMLRNKMEVKAYIGTPEQCITLEIETGKSLTWVIDSTTPNVEMEPRFHSELSETFLRQGAELPSEFKFHQVETGHQFYDMIRVGDTTINATMVIPKTLKVVNRRGVIGLHKELPGTFLPSLITQYQAQSKVSSYEFSIEYTSPTTGIVAFGQAYRYENTAKLIFYTQYEKDTVFSAYVITGNYIQFNEESNRITRCKISVDETFGFMLGPYKNKEYIEGIYKLKDPRCHEKESWFDQGLQTFRIYYYYLCDNAFVEENIPTYGSLSAKFNNKKNDIISMEKEEMFQDFNATHKIFVMSFKKGETRNHDWIFGAPFLKKYKVIYNLFKGSIGFMTYDPSYKKSSISNLCLMIGAIVIFSLVTFGISMSGLIIKGQIKKRQEGLISKDIDYEYHNNPKESIIPA